VHAAGGGSTLPSRLSRHRLSGLFWTLRTKRVELGWFGTSVHGVPLEEPYRREKEGGKGNREKSTRLRTEMVLEKGYTQVFAQ